MNYLVIFVFFLGTVFTAPAYAVPYDGKAEQDALRSVDAKGALILANQWKWSKKEIQTYVNGTEAGFRFPDRKVVKIPLPADKMVVAIAPYVKRTHT